MKLHQLALCTLLAAAAVPSHAVGRLVDVDVLDRATGAVLPVYSHRGEYWIAGSPGRAYAIVLRNRAGERLLAVTAVDGVNVLSGETAGWDQSGYVLAPSHRYQVTGWRKSRSEVAAFAFASSDAAYASRTGRPDHVGVIGVAVFRERRPVAEPRWSPPEMDNRSDLDRDAGPGAGRRVAPSASASARDAAGGESRSERAAPAAQAEPGSDASRALGKALSPAAPAPRLGTAHGERESSWVTHTTFTRRHARPDDIIRIRYDSRENLIASGVIRVPLPSRVDPFPASAQAGYVPDPPPRY
ncbi:hypothetical protein O4H66_17565 [Comamonadaceae bacterium G21597-S1]|nr:hypothetical protein [Comamonadaceae bacterium G21597-S1]